MYSFPEKILRFLPTILCILALGYLILMADRGFDFTDESSYLNWISNPWLYPLSVTQYGFVYHPLYKLVGGSIAALRQLNLLITVGLASLMTFAVLRGALRSQYRIDVVSASAICLPLGFTSVLVLGNWLITPNYNILNLQGLLISTIALALIGRERPTSASSRFPLFAFMLLAVGGWLVFMAKPSSAALLAPVALIYLLSIGRLTFSGVLVAALVAGGLLVATAYVMDGSIPTFIARLTDAVSLAAAMDNSYSLGSILRISPFGLSNWELGLLLCLAATTAISVVLAGGKKRLGPIAAAAILAGFLVLAAAALLGVRQIVPAGWSNWYAMQISALPLGVGLIVVWSLLRSDTEIWASGGLQMVCLLVVLPYIHAIGTNGNYWTAAAFAGVFWATAALLLLQMCGPKSIGSHASTSVAMMSLAITAAVVGVGMEFPYRQVRTIRASDQVVNFVGGGSLRLSGDFAGYMRAMQKLAEASGFKPGTPLIDLTGHYPGISPVLGSLAVGQAWMIGGYPGSNTLAAASLRRVSCSVLATSWLLVEKEGPRALSMDVLNFNGARFEPVGPVASPLGSYPQSYQHYLMRPAHDPEAVAERCRLDRGN